MTSLSKVLEIQQLIRQEKLDILAINETNLKSDIDSDTLSLPHNFDFIRRDRPTDTGRGGCGILVSKNINAREVPLELNNANINKIEAIWLEIKQFKIYICCFYRSNNYCPVDDFLEYMTQSIYDKIKQ